MEAALAGALDGHGSSGLTGVVHVIFLVLVCAVLAALAGGVLMAYGICYGMFQMFRIHSLQVAQARLASRALPVAAVDTLA